MWQNVHGVLPRRSSPGQTLDIGVPRYHCPRAQHDGQGRSTLKRLVQGSSLVNLSMLGGGGGAATSYEARTYHTRVDTPARTSLDWGEASGPSGGELTANPKGRKGPVGREKGRSVGCGY